LRWRSGVNVGEHSLDATLRKEFSWQSAGQVSAPRVGDFGSHGLQTVFRDAPEIRARSADELFSALIPEELRAAVMSASTVVIVPDGPLHTLCFQSLLIDEAAGSRWIDQGPPTVIAPSLAALRRSRLTPGLKETNSAVLAAVADYAPFRRIAADARTMPALNDLPGAAFEIAELARLFRSDFHWTDVVALPNTKANPPQLLASLRSPRIVHIAAHTLSATSDLEHDALVLSPIDPNHPDGGIVPLRDLLNVWRKRLAGTDLAVLSACRTAFGPLEAGDGPASLQFALLGTAGDGARSVLSSRWPVNDAATALLMTRFYQEWLGAKEASSQPTNGRVTKAVALQRAQRWLRQKSRAEGDELLESLRRRAGLAIPPLSDHRMRDVGRAHADRAFSHPYYWAAFDLYGLPE
jgi:CHAT domain-containing protein